MTGMLAGKAALITGGSRGIGSASALVFARHGARVAIADIDVEGGEATARRVREAGGEAFFLRADVSRAEDVEAMVRAVVARFGRLDCAFNNAGIESEPGLTADCTDESFNRVLAVNLTSVFLCMKHEIRQIRAQGGGGAIVNNASAAGLMAFPGLPAYVASKHGVVGLTRAAAIEYVKEGIRINVVCPGVILTPMVQASMARQGISEAQLAAHQPIGRLGTTEEVAEAAAWLCSDRASFLVGHAMAVDGGMVIA